MPHELIIKACESLRERVSALRDVDRHLVNIEFLATCVVVRLQIEQLIELERILMPRLNDVLVQANTTIQAQNAQIANLQNQLATAQAGQGDPVLALDAQTVPDANALGATLGIAPLDGQPLTPPATATAS